MGAVADLVRFVGEVGVVTIPTVAERFGVSKNKAKELAKSAGLIGRGKLRTLAVADVEEHLVLAGLAAPKVVVPVPRVILGVPVGKRSAPWLPVWACRSWPVDDSQRRVKLRPPAEGTTREQLVARYKFLQPQPGDGPRTARYRARAVDRFEACVRDLHDPQAAHTATRFDFNRLYTSTHRQIGVVRSRDAARTKR